MSVKLIATKTTQHHKAGDRFVKPKNFAKAMVKFRLAKYDDSVQEEIEELSDDIRDESEMRSKNYSRRDMSGEDEKPKKTRKKRAYKRRDLVAEDSQD